MNNDYLKLIYSQIILGFSSSSLDSKIFYIKHLTARDSALIDLEKQKYLDTAKGSGAPTYQEKLDDILSKNLWSIDKDKRIQEIKDYIVNLKHSKTKLSTKRDITQFDKEIEKYDVELFSLVREKEKLIGKTAEFYAEKKTNEYYIYSSLYKDDEFSKKLYTLEQFYELENEELDKIVRIYNEKMGIFKDDNLKKIALMPYFMNLLIMADNNLYCLFGRSLMELSFYQIELMSHGRSFKNILQNSKVQPDAVTLKNPDKLVVWFDQVQNVDKILNDAPTPEDPSKRVLSDNKSVVGMSKEELKAQGIDTSAQDRINEALKKKGSELSMMELMQLEGHKVG